MEQFGARYNDGVTARTRDVRVSITANGLDILGEDGALLDRWPGEDIHLIDPKSSRGPTRLSVGEGDLARLTTDNPDVRAEIIGRFPNVLHHRRVSMATVQRVVGWSAFAIAGLVFVIWVVLPFAAVQIAGMIPQSIQSKVGERVSRQLISVVALIEKKRSADMICNSVQGDRALAKLQDRLAQNAPQDIDFKIRVINARLVNAVALPGGHILLTRGILKFVGDANEMAGVLGHEMGHVALNHAVENMIKVGGVTALFSLMVGDVAGGAVIIAVAEAVVRGSFTQEAERAADDFGVRLMNRGGFDARPMAAFFNRLAAMEKKKGLAKGTGRMREWMSSHPPTKDRAQYVLDLAEKGNDILSQAEWDALKKICD